MSKVGLDIHQIAAPLTGQVSPENMVLLGKQLTTTLEKVSLFFQTLFHVLSQGYQVAKALRADYFTNKTISLILSTNLQLLTDKINGLGQDLIQRQILRLSDQGVIIHNDTDHYRHIQSLHRGYELIQECRANPATHWLKHFAKDEFFGKNFETFNPISDKNHFELIISFDDFLKEHSDFKDFISNLHTDSHVASALFRVPLSPGIAYNRYEKLLRFQKNESPRKNEMAREFISALAPDLIEKSQVDKELKAIQKLIKFCEKEIDHTKTHSPQFLATALKALMKEKDKKGLGEFSEACDAIFNGEMVKSMKGICESLVREMKKQEVKRENVLENAMVAIQKSPFDAVYNFVPQLTANLIDEKDKPKVTDLRVTLLPLKNLFDQSPYVIKGVKGLSTLLKFLPKDASPQVAKEFIGKKISGFNALDIGKLAQLHNRHAYRQALDDLELGIWMKVAEAITDNLIDAHQKIVSKSEEKGFFIDFIKTTLPKIVKDKESITNWIGRLQKFISYIPGLSYIVKKIVTKNLVLPITKDDSIDDNTKIMLKKSVEPITQIVLLLVPAILKNHNIDAHLNFLQNLNGLLNKEQIDDDALFIEVMKGVQQLTRELANYGGPLEEALIHAKDRLMA